MPIRDEFINVKCSPFILDIYVIRRAIFGALMKYRHHYVGTLLDIGCGHMPYREILLAKPSRVSKYIGLDLVDNIYQKPDLEWNGQQIPLDDDSVDCALATEVFEHCPEPEVVMREALRVLKTGGTLFFTVPFLWPLHCVPHDEYRYTPFSLERHLRAAGFSQIEIRALGGWEASLAQLISLWALRRPMPRVLKAFVGVLATPIVYLLNSCDRPPLTFGESCMITGLYGIATK